MSEIYNYNPEFVSADELEVLADFYTQKIKEVDEELKKLPDQYEFSEIRKDLRKQKFKLMNRRYYLRICHRARNH